MDRVGSQIDFYDEESQVTSGAVALAASHFQKTGPGLTESNAQAVGART